MRRPIIAGNWKMNKLVGEAAELATRLREGLGELDGVTVIIAPPFTALKTVADVIKGSPIFLAGQNLHEAPGGKGAFTGEISAEMLVDVGCRYVIVGHSERRHLFGESGDRIQAKLSVALSYGLIPIFCLGETLREREGNETLAVLESQLKEGLKNMTGDDISRIIIAYEPVWAIGTGKTATPEQAEEAHLFIRGFIAEKYGQNAAAAMPILYGGSVTPGNISELMAKQNIDGALVGGASLEAASFLKIVKF